MCIHSRKLKDMINVKYSGVMIMGLDKVRKKKKNKMRNRYIYRASILLVLVAAIIYTLMTNLTGEKVTRQDIGDEAPNFELVQVNDNHESTKVNLSELKGQGVMLNFWGTWCAPCREAMPRSEERRVGQGG